MHSFVGHANHIDRPHRALVEKIRWNVRLPRRIATRAMGLGRRANFSWEQYNSAIGSRHVHHVRASRALLNTSSRKGVTYVRSTSVLTTGSYVRQLRKDVLGPGFRRRWFRCPTPQDPRNQHADIEFLPLL